MTRPPSAGFGAKPEEIEEALNPFSDIVARHSDDIARIAGRLAPLPTEEWLQALSTDEEWRELIDLLVVDTVNELTTEVSNERNQLTPSVIRDKLIERIAAALRRILPRPDRLPTIADIFPGGVAPVPTDLVTWSVIEAILHAPTKTNWTNNDHHEPTHVTFTNKGQGAINISVRGDDDLSSDAPENHRALWDQVSALDDLTSDVLLVCLARWVGQTNGPDTPVWITADAILDARGIKRKRYPGEPSNWQHGHRRDDRMAVGRALAQLGTLWLEIMDVEVIPGTKRRKPQRIRIESRALSIEDRVTQHDIDGNVVFLAARIKPGSWAREYWELGVRQTGLLAQKAVAYDPYRQQIEKRLAKYLCFQFRINARKGQPAELRLKVSTLLHNAAIAPETRNPQRTRSRLEQALTRLQADDLITSWSYVVDVDSLPAKGWLSHWLEKTVRLEIPSALRSQYARLALETRT